MTTSSKRPQPLFGLAHNVSLFVYCMFKATQSNTQKPFCDSQKLLL